MNEISKSTNSENNIRIKDESEKKMKMKLEKIKKFCRTQKNYEGWAINAIEKCYLKDPYKTTLSIGYKIKKS